MTAAIKAAKAAGCENVRVEIEQGRIIVITTDKTAAGVPSGNEWDEKHD